VRRTARRGGIGATDRRTLRGERTRNELVDSVIQLLEAGNHRPTIAEVAERAGVSRRIISYHFHRVDVLFGNAAATQVERYRFLIAELPPRGPVDTRIRATCHQRRQLFEAISPILRMVRPGVDDSPGVRAVLAGLHAELLHQVLVTLGPEISSQGPDAPVLLQTVDAATGWEQWDVLRIRIGCSPAAAERAMVYSVTHLFQ
jgi:AcrR family transcriptional regulator